MTLIHNQQTIPNNIDLARYSSPMVLQSSYLFSTLINPIRSVLVCYSPRDLQSTRPCLQRFPGSIFVARPKHHHMPSAQVIVLVELGVVTGG